MKTSFPHPRMRCSGPTGSRQRGVALVMVLLAVVVAVILALSFQSAQSTTVPIAQNINHHATARNVTESAMTMVVNHIRTVDTWREDFAAGRLPVNAAFSLGTFTVTVEDGQDLDGDGVISSPDEGDGDLANDPTQPVTVTVVGRVGNATHKLRAVVAAFDEPGVRLKLLLVVKDAKKLDGADEARINQFESWEFEVKTISEGESQGTFDAEVNDADVVYVSSSAEASKVKTKLNAAEIGIVAEPAGLAQEWQMASTIGSETSTRIHVVNNTHEITEPFALGDLEVGTNDLMLNRFNSPRGAHVDQLATHVSSIQSSLMAVEAGGSLLSGAAAGRRVMLPFGGGAFTFGQLSTHGKTLVYRSLVWASKAPKGPPAVAHWRLDESTGNIAYDSNGDNHGTSFDGTSWTAGRLLNGHDFDGVNDYIQIPDASVLRPTTALTICAWVRGNAWDSGDNVDLILRKGEGNPNNWQLSITNKRVALSLDAWDGQNDKGNVYGNTLLETDRWYHVAATWDGTTARIYLDGVVDNGSGKSVSGPINSDTRPVYIGGRAGGGAHDRFGGILDDVRLYNRALTGSELRTIINEATAQDANATPQLITLYDFIEVKPTPQLIGHWTLDDSGGGGGGMAATDQISVNDKGRIDSYRSSRGGYDIKTNAGHNAAVATNSTSSGKFYMEVSTSLWGDGFCGVSGSPNTVFNAHSGTISGQRLALGSSVPISNNGSPSLLVLSEGNKSFSNTQTWNSDRTFGSLTLSGSAAITISGKRTIHCTGNLSLSNSARIIIPEGSSLTLHVGGTVTLRGTSSINHDASAPGTGTGRLTLIAYNDSSGIIDIGDSAIVTGMLRADQDLIVRNTARLFGAALVRDDITIYDEARVHLDGDMPNLGVAAPPAHDEVETSHGRIHGGASGGLIGSLIGIVVNTIQTTTTALGFDGTDDRVIIQHHDNYLLRDGAVSFWFKSNKSGTKQGLFAKDTQGTGDGQVAIWIESNKVQARLESASSAYTLSASAALSTNTWHHVALTFGQGGLKLYVNGTLAASHTYAGGLGDPIKRTGNFQPIYLGATPKTSTSGFDYLSGSMDDVRLYDYVLDLGQVNDLRQGRDIGPSTLPGAVVHDTSNYGSPLNLPVADTSKIVWLNSGLGGLQVTSPQAMASLVNASKIHLGVSKNKQVSLEVDFAPSVEAMSNAATIVGYGSASARNLGLDHSYSRWNAAIKLGGSVSSVNSGDVLIPEVREHLIVTYDGQNINRFRNGQWLDSTPASGDFASWVLNHPITVAGEADGSRAWTGKLYRIAIYDRAFNKTQARNVFNGQPPGSGATSGAGAVRYIEMP